MTIPSKSDVAREFGKQELLSICKELKIQVDEGEHIYRLVSILWQDLDDQGVPVSDDVSDLLYEFLLFCKYYDQGGKIIEVVEEDEPEIEIATVDDDGDLPECFGWGEPKYNPNCKRCVLREECVERRDTPTEENICFIEGLYDPESPTCAKCCVFRTCKDRADSRA